MSYYYDNFVEFFDSLLSRVQIIKKSQLALALVNYFDGIGLTDAHNIIQKYQTQGRLIIGDNGYVFSRAAYRRITNDYREENLVYHRKYRFQNAQIYENKIDESCIQCLWIVIDMLPGSFNFIKAYKPWDFIFEMKNSTNKTNLYEVMYISKESELYISEIMNNQPSIKSSDVRESLIRIAVIEDEDDAKNIPYFGFKYIVSIDHTDKTHYKILEERSMEERWKAYEKKESLR